LWFLVHSSALAATVLAPRHVAMLWIIKEKQELETSLQSGFYLSVTKPEQIDKQPITPIMNNTRNQWKLEVNARDRRQARENACDQVAISSGVHQIGWVGGAH